MFRHVLHDRPDEECVKILSNLMSTKGPPSRIVLEQVIPNQRASLLNTDLDIHVMRFGGQGRSGKQWSGLLDSVDSIDLALSAGQHD